MVKLEALKAERNMVRPIIDVLTESRADSDHMFCALIRKLSSFPNGTCQVSLPISLPCYAKFLAQRRWLA
jgi:hypothetical protein